jgi:hypothetical protein
MDKPDWFFIIFAPGTGGNHLANLISTDFKFLSRVDQNFYNNLNNDAHPKPDFLFENVINRPPDNNIVTCCHLSNYLWNQTKIDKIFANKKFLVIEFPGPARNKLFNKRLLQLYPYYYSSEFLMEELATVYSVETIKKLIDSQDITPVAADKIFNKDLTMLIDFLYTDFGLVLDQSSKFMHDKWIKMLEK